MDFTLLSRLRAKRYRYRILAFAFACIACGITAIFFWKFQSTHVQNVWNFKNVGRFWNETIDLDPNVTYKISWKEKTSIPYLLTINDKEVATPNIQRTCRYCYYNYKYAISEYLTSPFYLKLKQETTFGLHFTKFTPPDFSKPFGDFMRDWFSEWFDGVAPHEWSVERMDNKNKYNLLFNESINIIQRRK